MRIELDLPCTAKSARQAREALAGLAPNLGERRLGELRLLVSEVVTNAVRHSGLDDDDLIHLNVSMTADHVRVEVANAGPGFTPEHLEPCVDRAGGWGLYLVAQIAEDWGVERDGETVVWFELAA